MIHCFLPSFLSLPSLFTKQVAEVEERKYDIKCLSYVCMRRSREERSWRVIIENNNNDYLAPGCRTETPFVEGVSVDALMIPFAPSSQHTLRENENCLFLFFQNAFRVISLASDRKQNRTTTINLNHVN